jgi:hypothetical protein
MINVTKEELFNMILKLQERLDLIDGRPRGPISMREARLANERGDKATLQKYYDQFTTRERATSPAHEGGDHLPTGRESRPAAESHSPAERVKK